MAAETSIRRLTVDRRDYVNYRVRCPRCGEVIGPRHAIREFLDVPPDPPYAAFVRCPSCGETFYLEFTPPTG